MELFTSPETAKVHKRIGKQYATCCGKSIDNLVMIEASTDQLSNTLRDSQYTLCEDCKVQHIVRYNNE